ncbi:Protein EGL-23 a [Aphelenchoides avenae]|nr:Protein EGL-23 a [Aphelenchus avenae]
MGFLNNTTQGLMSRMYLFNKASPIAVHIFMVLGVALYAIFGAVVMQRLESKAVDRDRDGDTLAKDMRSQTKRHILPSTPEIQAAVNGSRLAANESNAGIPVSVGSPPSADEEGRPKREFDQFMRSKKCVMEAMNRILDQQCHQGVLRKAALQMIDKCYYVTVKDDGTLKDLAFKYSTAGIELVDSAPDYIEPWSFTDAVLFSFTIITTIGYGNVAPKTHEGRLFCILYGLIGIPFTLLAIADLGKFLSEMLDGWQKACTKFYKRVRQKAMGLRKSISKSESLRKMATGSIRSKGVSVEELQKLEDGTESLPQPEDEKSQMSRKSKRRDSDDEDQEIAQTVPLIIMFVVYVFAGAFLMSMYEPDMTFFKAVYFNYVSLTSIGLGDIVPRSETYMAFTIIYIAIGLALTTIAIEIAADYLKKLHYFGRKIENVGSVAIWFGGKKLTMKQLVRNLGDQFNLPTTTIKTLDLDTFVDNAIKVEEGELETLRPPPFEPEESTVIYADEDKESWTPQKTPSPSPTPEPSREPTPEPEPEPEPEPSPEPPRDPTPEPPRDPTPEPEPEPEPESDPEPEFEEEDEELPPSPPPLPKPKSEIDIQSERRKSYSEEAWRRYLEYQKQWRKFRQTQMVTGPVSAALTAAIGTMGVAAGPMPGSSSSSSTNTIYSPKSAIVQSVFPRLKGQAPSKGKRKSEPNTKHKK